MALRFPGGSLPCFFNNRVELVLKNCLFYTLPQICNLRYITGYGGIKYLSGIEYAFYWRQDGRFVKIFICENLRFCTSFILSRLSFWMPFRYSEKVRKSPFSWGPVNHLRKNEIYREKRVLIFSLLYQPETPIFRKCGFLFRPPFHLRKNNWM